jgi:hypothetical protein
MGVAVGTDSGDTVVFAEAEGLNNPLTEGLDVDEGSGLLDGLAATDTLDDADTEVLGLALDDMLGLGLEE